MKKLLLTCVSIITAFASVKAQYSAYDGIDGYFTANPDLPNRAPYAGRSVNPNYLLIDWNRRDEMGTRMISNGFVQLGVSIWDVPYNAHGGGVPERDCAIACLLDRYHATAEALAEYSHSIGSLRIADYWGDYGL